MFHFQDTDEVQQSSACLNCWKAAVLVEGVSLAFLAVTVGILVVEGRAKRIRKGTEIIEKMHLYIYWQPMLACRT